MIYAIGCIKESGVPFDIKLHGLAGCTQRTIIKKSIDCYCVHFAENDKKFVVILETLEDGDDIEIAKILKKDNLEFSEKYEFLPMSIKEK